MENVDSVICEYSNMKYSDGSLYLKNPEEFDPSFIHSRVFFISGRDTTTLNVSIRSWINGKYSLSEINPHNPSISLFWEAIKRKLGVESNFEEVLLLTKNDSSYLYNTFL